MFVAQFLLSILCRKKYIANIYKDFNFITL